MNTFEHLLKPDEDGFYIVFSLKPVAKSRDIKVKFSYNAEMLSYTTFQFNHNDESHESN